MMAIKDPTTIMQEIADIYRRAGVPDMVPGTFEWDLFVYGPTYGAIYPVWMYLKDFDAFLRGDFAAVPPEYIARILSSFGLEGKEGTYAEGYVVFYTETTPTDPIIIPEGTIVAVEYDSSITFETTSGIYVEPDFLDAYFDGDKYKFILPIRATAPGDRFNVPPGVITLIVSNIAHIDGVINESATTGGSNPINLESSFDTLSQLFLSRHPLSEAALRQILSEKFPEAGSLVILRPGDPENLSDVYGTTTEIYISSGVPSLTTEKFFVVSNSEYILKASPFLGVVSVNSDTGPIEECVDGSTDFCYEVLLSSDPVSVGTIFDRGKIVFKNVVSPIHVEVSYNYNSLVQRMQLYLDGIDTLPNVKFVVRQAPSAEIILSVKVKLYPGADIDQVRSDVFTQISQLLSNLDMGGMISVSDLLGPIINHEFVDDVFLGTVSIDVVGNASFDGDYVVAGRNSILSLADVVLYE